MSLITFSFQINNERNTSCHWVVSCLNFGKAMALVFKVEGNGCLKSEFDQYGDKETSGIDSEWQRQLLKFASVQDRLREWQLMKRDHVMLRDYSCSCNVTSRSNLSSLLPMPSFVHRSEPAPKSWHGYVGTNDRPPFREHNLPLTDAQFIAGLVYSNF